MGTPWDRGNGGYLEQWLPRFVPYQLDLVREMALRPGARVFVTRAGPGAEVLAAARAVGSEGAVHATDPSPEMVRICRDQVARARLPARVEVSIGDATATGEGTWDAIVSAFAFEHLPDRDAVLRAWGAALVPQGKLGVLAWGPDEPEGPFTKLQAFARELEPTQAAPEPAALTDRTSMSTLFDRAGLVMVRHTVVAHTLTFSSAEAFLRALREASAWHRLADELGEGRFEPIATRFYEWCGGPDEPLSFDAPATIAIALRAA